jgi:hypothetical protein
MRELPILSDPASAQVRVGLWSSSAASWSVTPARECAGRYRFPALNAGFHAEVWLVNGVPAFAGSTGSECQPAPDARTAYDAIRELGSSVRRRTHAERHDRAGCPCKNHWGTDLLR